MHEELLTDHGPQPHALGQFVGEPASDLPGPPVRPEIVGVVEGHVHPRPAAVRSTHQRAPLRRRASRVAVAGTSVVMSSRLCSRRPASGGTTAARQDGGEQRRPERALRSTRRAARRRRRPRRLLLATSPPSSRIGVPVTIAVVSEPAAISAIPAGADVPLRAPPLDASPPGDALPPSPGIRSPRYRCRSPSRPTRLAPVGPARPSSASHVGDPGARRRGAVVALSPPPRRPSASGSSTESSLGLVVRRSALQGDPVLQALADGGRRGRQGRRSQRPHAPPSIAVLEAHSAVSRHVSAHARPHRRTACARRRSPHVERPRGDRRLRRQAELDEAPEAAVGDKQTAVGVQASPCAGRAGRCWRARQEDRSLPRS